MAMKTAPIENYRSISTLIFLAGKIAVRKQIADCDSQPQSDKNLAFVKFMKNMKSSVLVTPR